MPEEIVAIAMTAMISGTVIILYSVRTFAMRHRLERGATLPKQMDQRLERIEQAVDSIAIEVERISEAQRFTTKLLADRSAAEPARRDS